MAELKLHIGALKKDVFVDVGDEKDRRKAFNAAAAFVQGLLDNDKIRDLDVKLNPSGATHEVVKDKNGNYRLNRFRFG